MQHLLCVLGFHDMKWRAAVRLHVCSRCAHLFA
jgi:hypothetical protein